MCGEGPYEHTHSSKQEEETVNPYQLESLAAERIRERQAAAHAARLAREGRRAKRRPRGERATVRAPRRDSWLLERLPRTYVGRLRGA